MPNTRVLIAEDYSFFRDTLEQLISGDPEIEVVGRSSEKDQAIEVARALQPDILIIDIGLLGSGGLDAVREIKTELPLTQVVVIGDEGGEEYSRVAQEGGAAAYIVKATMRRELIPTIGFLAANNSRATRPG